LATAPKLGWLASNASTTMPKNNYPGNLGKPCRTVKTCLS